MDPAPALFRKILTEANRRVPYVIMIRMQTRGTLNEEGIRDVLHFLNYLLVKRYL